MNTKILITFLTIVLINDGDGINWKGRSVVHDEPVNVMTDVINDLGVKLLNCYIDHPGNVAFSPTGLAFVLLSLYEGSGGHANRQIAHVLGLPPDRRITRIGTRDIYRRLRSYLNADAFLGGLTLNRDNIMLRPEYEDILRFYGFNVANGSVNGTLGDQSSSTTENPTSPSSADTSTLAASEESTTVPSAPLQVSEMTTESSTSPPTTTVPTNDADMATPQNLVESTTIMETTTIPSETTTIISTVTAAPTTTETSSASLDVRMDTSTLSSTTPIADSTTTPTTDSPTVDSTDNSVRKRRNIQPRSFTHYPMDPVWMEELIDYPTEDEMPELDGQQTTEMNFLVHNCDISTISTTTYSALLPFAYFPYLRAFGLEFPLDDPRYSVIVLVPSEANDSRNLARLLCTKTLRRLRNFMKPMWVKATIPSFMLRGFITLTPFIQKLGITDTFEPRSADLSLMSPDLGIYARDVQQSIGVNIRNYMKDSNDTLPSMTNRRNYPGSSGHSREPIPFIADRPFLFFIVDTETSVALIAGHIDDPLNSRIN